MSYITNTSELQQQIKSCMKCGNCQAVCPLYKATRDETTVARGKMHLAEAIVNGNIEFSKKISQIFEKCLTCKACTLNCPSGVDVNSIVLASRATGVYENGVPIIKKMIFKVLSMPKIFKTGMFFGSLFQNIVFKKRVQGMSPRFPISGLQLRRVLPELNRKTFLSRMKTNNETKGRHKVAFFIGCTNNYIFPEVGDAVLKVLEKNNIDVVVPKNQHCCGIPVFVHGDIETAKSMAKSHVDMFLETDADFLITVCGTCGEAFKKYYGEILSEDKEYFKKANILASKTHDIADFLVNIKPYSSNKLKTLNMTVTYHEPCHIGRGLGVSEQHVNIIESIPGIEFRKLKDYNTCCGGAGSFSLTHYDLSYKVLKRKIDNIKDTNAQTIITGCGSCRMQIDDGIAQEALDQNIIHTIELLAQAYR